jgi:hypothetical protein
MLSNGLHAYTTLTNLGENHEYLLIVAHGIKKGWQALKASSPFMLSKVD